MEFERLSPEQFELFGRFIYRESGIRIDERKVTLLSNRIRRRLRAGDFENFNAYYQFLTSASGSDERDEFLNAITTNETFFFRTQKHFDWLKQEFLPEMLRQQRSGDRPASLRFWSAGCANGAEPYSIAICLAEDAPRFRSWDMQVLGTDISEEVLQMAREATYKPRSVDAVTESQRRRYFHRNDESWRVCDDVKKVVEFKKHNLMKPLFERPFDCIFIRNVLIYFDRESKQKVITNLIAALADGGYLVVGPSEGIFEMLGSLKRISPLLYQKVAKNSSEGRP